MTAAARKVDDGTAFAISAARQVEPFLAQLIAKYDEVVAQLRRGKDSDALLTLGELTDDLEYFLKFLVLVHDYVEAVDAPASIAVRTYRERLLSVIESIEPALGDSDLVEVADALEDDLVPALAAYSKLDAAVKQALGA